MSTERGPGEGRVRRAPTIIAAVVALAVVLTLPRLVGLVGQGSPAGEPGPRGRLESPREGLPELAIVHGSLAFTSFDTDGKPGRRQRLFLFDLRSGAILDGPLVPSATRELVAVGPGRRAVAVLAASPPRPGVSAWVVPIPRAGDEPRALVAADLVAVSTDGRSLLGVDGTAEVRGCAGGGFRAERLRLPSGGPIGIRESCGSVVSSALLGDLPILTVVSRTREPSRTFVGDARLPGVFDGLAVVSAGPGGAVLFARGTRDGSGAKGHLLVWPGAGGPRPLVRGDELVPQRVLAWSADGSRLVVDGVIGGRRALWLVYVPAGTVQPLLPPRTFELGTTFSGAAFDDRGSAFASSAGVIVVSTDAGVFPITLPPEAPTPAGPIAWLP